MNDMLRSAAAAAVFAATTVASIAAGQGSPAAGYAAPHARAPVPQARWDDLSVFAAPNDDHARGGNQHLFYNYGDDGTHDTATGGPSGGIN